MGSQGYPRPAGPGTHHQRTQVKVLLGTHNYLRTLYLTSGTDGYLNYTLGTEIGYL